MFACLCTKEWLKIGPQQKCSKRVAGENFYRQSSAQETNVWQRSLKIRVEYRLYLGSYVSLKWPIGS